MANPMYRQIAENLRAQIESGKLEPDEQLPAEFEQVEPGKLKPGQQLPTELELQQHYKASRNTVREAIKWLTTLGLVETRPGQGTFVVEEIDPFVTTLSGDPAAARGGTSHLSEVSGRNREPSSLRTLKVDIQQLQVEIQQASQDVAAGLWRPEGTEVISRHERCFIDGTPWAMQTSFYPMEFADRGAERLRRARNIEEGTVHYLAETLHIKQVGYRDWITVRAPNSTEADFFKLPPDGRVSMYEIFRTAFDGNGQPMRLTITVYPADRNQFIIDVGDVPRPQSAEDSQSGDQSETRSA